LVYPYSLYVGLTIKACDSNVEVYFLQFLEVSTNETTEDKLYILNAVM